MGICRLLVNVRADVAPCVFYDLGIKEVYRITGDFMRKFDRWYYTIYVLYESGK